jgi:hypothetical protein
MLRYNAEEVYAFLRELDSELVRPAEITVIGGAAIGLIYDDAHTTTDVDLVPGNDEAFWQAVDRARSHHPIPVSSVSIYEAPYEWEGRRIQMHITATKKITVLVPEAHDLAMMKVARGETHDLQAIEDIHAKQPLSVSTLIERYYDTLTQHIGALEDLRLSFLALVTRLFGAKEADRVEHLLATQKPPPLSV